MSFFSKIFSPGTKTPDPDIQFGRFTDTYKEDTKYKSWELSIENFENEKYLVAYAHLLDFLSIENHKNLMYKKNNGKIQFSIFQGSKIIEGETDFNIFKAEAKIIISPSPNLGLMRHLLEENFNLKYTRYAVDENGVICLIFDTFVEDGSPHKIYQALKELATEADRKDDVLMHKFNELTAINYTHMRHVSETEKKIKFDYLKLWCQEALHEIDQNTLNSYLYPGGISFVLLDFFYRIDFLLKPEGNMMEKIREIHEMYFNDNFTTVHDKNKIMIKAIRQFSEITYEDFSKEIYEVNSTFGISMPEGHQRLAEITEIQMTDFEWYQENKYYNHAYAICGYVAGFSLYAYSLPEPSKALLKLYYRITQNDYFNALGFTDRYKDTHGQYNIKMVKNAIKSIQTTFEHKYGKINIDIQSLKFDNNCNFCKSYLMMIKNLEYQD